MIYLARDYSWERHRQDLADSIQEGDSDIAKYNEHHDELGRFATGDGAASMSQPENPFPHTKNALLLSDMATSMMRKEFGTVHRDLLSEWVRGTDRLPALAIEDAVAEQFGGECWDRTNGDKYGGGEALAAYAEHEGGDARQVRDMIRRQYEVTQQALARYYGNQKFVTMYRGAPAVRDLHGVTDIETDALSSWSTSKSAAEDFARTAAENDVDRQAYVFEAKVPIADIFASWHTAGPLQGDEAEVMVMSRGRPRLVRVEPVKA